MSNIYKTIEVKLKNGTIIREIIKKQFGKYTVIGDSIEYDYKNAESLLCKCICGAERLITLYILKNKPPETCKGCRNKKYSSTILREKNRWRNIKDRCYNSKRKCFYLYGGRGIKMCDKWKNSFDSFLKDMGEAPFKNAQIDRIDPDGNYEPGNCRWTTPQENISNRRCSKKNREQYIYIHKEKFHEMAMELIKNNKKFSKRIQVSYKEQLSLF